MFYFLAVLVTFCWLTETDEPNLSQRKLVMIAAASIVWPLVGLGILFESRRQLIGHVYTLLDIDPVANWEFEPEFEVDPETTPDAY